MKKKIIYCVFVLVLFFLDVYLFIGYRLSDAFFSRSYVMDCDVSGLSVEEAEEKVKDRLSDNYEIELLKNDGTSDVLTCEDLSYTVNLSLSEIFKEQNPFLWVSSLFSDSFYETDYSFSFDAEKALNSLSLFSEETLVYPENAYLSDYREGLGYEIIPEVRGNVLDREKTLSSLTRAVEEREPFLDLKECYIEPEITKEDASLLEELERMNSSVSAVIRYDLEGSFITLDADTYHAWLTVTENGVTVDEDMAAEWVETLRETDTAYTDRTFVSSTDGREVTVTGPYGYRIAPNDERTQLIEDILSGEEITREPVYVRKGASRQGNDYGTTFVEVDLTCQKVYLYVEGELIKSSDCVTGNVSAGNETPPGIYPITYTQRNATLKGPGYSSFVNFWMPFNGGIGLHDATWRASFGGNIYKTNGSHGCINLPYSMAETVFSYAYAGMPVICYN